MGQIAEACEAIVFSSGLADEAYQRYALAANRTGTYLATFRAIHMRSQLLRGFWHGQLVSYLLACQMRRNL